jgi:hypothetical protein
MTANTAPHGWNFPRVSASWWQPILLDIREGLASRFIEQRGWCLSMSALHLIRDAGL